MLGGFDIMARKEKLKTRIVLAIFDLLHFFSRTRARARTPTCLENLERIDGAKELWAMRAGTNPKDSPTWDDLTGYDRLRCPQGGTYTIGATGESASCSIAEHTSYYRQHLDDYADERDA